MKTLLSMGLALILFSCGGSDKDENSSVNGMEADQRYTSMANSYAENNLMVDNLRLFKLDLVKDKTFSFFRSSRRGEHKILITGIWKVLGTQIVLEGVGTGNYMDYTNNEISYDCIYFNTQSLSEVVRDEYRKTGAIGEIPLLQFCKLRK